MALRESKGNMYRFVTHTWNPIKGRCPHDCSYCLSEGTMILMGDFTQQPIEDIKRDQIVIGIEKTETRYLRFTRSRVLNVSKRIAKTLKIETDDNWIICTPDHSIMGSTEARNCSDWKTAKAFSPYENLRFVHRKGREHYCRMHRLGYLRGIIDGDGCIFSFKNKEGRKYQGFEIVCTNEELSLHIESEFKDILGVTLKRDIKRSSSKSYGTNSPMLYTRVTKNVKEIERQTEFRINDEFARGYLAGMIDTDGSVSKRGNVRISQSRTANARKYKNIISCCDMLKLNYIEEKNIIRLQSSFEIRMKLLFEFGIFHSEKADRLILGKSVKGSKHSRINSIEIAGEMAVFNLQTECENYIANGFVVHNCYMRRFPFKDLQLDEKELRTDLGNGRFIFVGSSTDMWAEAVPFEWIAQVIRKCSLHDNIYLFQSKNPNRFHQIYLPESFKHIFATTIETNRRYPCMGKAPAVEERAQAMERLWFHRRMITIEPILDFDLPEFLALIRTAHPEWVNIGADSGRNGLPEPGPEKIRMLIEGLRTFTDVKIKSNLKIRQRKENAKCRRIK